MTTIERPASFTYPAQSTYTAAHSATKTRKISNELFEACYGLWAPGGKLVALRYATGRTRDEASRNAEKAKRS